MEVNKIYCENNLDEISKEYCELAEKRMKPYLMQQTMF